MSKVAIQGNASGTGTFTIAAPNSNTDRTLTLPDEAGTVLTSASDITPNSGTCFSYYRSSGDGDQAISGNTWTKVLFPTQDFDLGSEVTSSRFTPTVDGYYRLTAHAKLVVSSGLVQRGILGIRKNGVNVNNVYQLDGNAVTTDFDQIHCGGSIIMRLTPSDYAEVWIYGTGSATAPAVDATTNPSSAWFQGELIRKV